MNDEPLMDAVLQAILFFELSDERAIDEDTGNALVRRPNEKLSIRATRNLTNNSSAMIEAFGSSGHEDLYGAKISAYAVFNFAYKQTLSKNWQVSARISNLLDSSYEVISGYNTTPRSFLVNLRYQPDN